MDVGLLSRDAEPGEILHRLRLAGIAVEGTRLRVERRNGRILVDLDDDRIAWFPEQPTGRVAIESERCILRPIEKYCGFLVPPILYEDAGSWDVPAIVPGVAAADFLNQVKDGSSRRGAHGCGIGLYSGRAALAYSRV